jgi:poly-beta-1,6-N-acetyl-D-glucosamine N-deacetylase
MPWKRSLRLIKSFNIIGIVLLVTLGMSHYSLASDKFIAIVYHDITKKVVEPDDMPVDEFIKQLDFFKADGYQPISIKDIQAAAAGKKTLPHKALLLTFDDSYISFYQVVYPLLKLYKFPAVLSVVSSWIEGKNPGIYQKKQFMSWSQIKEVSNSGLVTIAAHSDNLHRFINANPQGNIEPADFTFFCNPKTAKYETDAQFAERIRCDLAQNQATFEQRLGIKPTVLTWPYGAYNQIGVQEAQQLGFKVLLTLNPGFADVTYLDRVSRYYAIPLLHWVPEFKEDLRRRFESKTPIRAVQLDLDKIVEPGSYEESNQNLGKCLERLLSLGVNTVFLQGFCDISGTGTVNSLYFANSVLPVKMDFLSHAVNRIRSRGMKCYVWMPVLSFELPDKKKNAGLLVRACKDGRIGRAMDSYRRLSPFDPESLAITRKIYRDLSAHVNFDGILLQDDAFLTDEEDFHPRAAAAFQQATGLELTPAVVKDGPIKERWIRLKTETLDNYIKELIGTIHVYRPTAKIARNIYSEAVTNPASQAWFAENLEAYLRSYDYTVIMAYSQMEKIGGLAKTKKWQQQLVNIVNRHQAMDRVIFKVQAFDWAKKCWVGEKTLVAEITNLLAIGARHVAYYPDGVIEDQPGVRELAPIICGQDFSRDEVTGMPPRQRGK